MKGMGSERCVAGGSCFHYFEFHDEQSTLLKHLRWMLYRYSLLFSPRQAKQLLGVGASILVVGQGKCGNGYPYMVHLNYAHKDAIYVLGANKTSKAITRILTRKEF